MPDISSLGAWYNDGAGVEIDSPRVGLPYDCKIGSTSEGYSCSLQ